jgi:hypothetical protein
MSAVRVQETSTLSISVVRDYEYCAGDTIRTGRQGKAPRAAHLMRSSAALLRA